MAPSRARVRFAVAALSAVGAFHAVGHAASPVPERVSLRDSTITWSTVKYATNAENGFVNGSLDKKTIVDRTFKAHVLENQRSCPNLAGAFFPLFTSRPATNSFIAQK